jgi:hypothetical protein
MCQYRSYRVWPYRKQFLGNGSKVAKSIVHCIVCIYIRCQQSNDNVDNCNANNRTQCCSPFSISFVYTAHQRKSADAARQQHTPQNGVMKINVQFEAIILIQVKAKKGAKGRLMPICETPLGASTTTISGPKTREYIV